ncbi:MAG TPA: alpha/beta hydrolase, partial [Allocoleopsis sp.]
MIKAALESFKARYLQRRRFCLPILQAVFSSIWSVASRFKSVLYLLLGFGFSLFLASQVHASGTVLLQSRDLTASIPLVDLQSFVSGQETSPALQQFLQDTDQNPAEVKQWLTTEITPPQLTPVISPDFVLLQINKVVGDPLGRESLDPLKTAFQRTLKTDNSFSILEILENYPKSQVRLELSRLGQVYNDVNLLVTRIEPVLRTTEALLPELLCNCNLAVTSELDNTEAFNPAQTSNAQISNAQKSIAYQQTRETIKSLLPVVDPTNSSEKSIPNSESSLIALETSDSPALANKTLVFQFGAFGRSISLQDLTRFAETGEISRGWRFFFNVAGVDPEAVRTALNEEVSVNLRFLDRTLNNLL